MNLQFLKPRRHPPNGGWSYWCNVGKMDFPGGFAFDVQIEKIREYRAANPSLNLPSDLGSVRHELLQFTFLRMRRQLGLEVTMEWFEATDTNDVEIEQLIKKKLPNLPSGPESSTATAGARPVEIIKIIRDAATGKRILRDWVGDGGVPVSPDKAQARANTCIACELNKPANLAQRLLGVVAAFIKEQMELKNQMSLKVENEDKLLTCQACNCPLPLKVWVPLTTIMLQTSELQRNGLDKNCWIRKEGGC